MAERLQKIISAAGLMSRRAAEQAILDGRVTVNGRTASLGESADADTDEIRVDGKPVYVEYSREYIVLYKPKGYVTTMSDEKGRHNVTELVADAGMRLYPVGRLDINSEGLLIMTNDGDFANYVMHPSGNILKTYRTWVRGGDIPSSIERLRLEMTIDGTSVKAKDVKAERQDAESARLLITIGEGRNRQIRKMCEYSGLAVTRLVRIKEGPVSLGDLKPGEWRCLTADEINAF